MKTLKIEFYQADMSSKGNSACASCDTIQQKLKSAVDSVKPLLSSLGTEIVQQTITIQTEEDAERHQVFASPTIRAGSFDFYPEHKDLGEERTWAWNGGTYSEPTEKVFSEVILRGYLGDVQQKTPTRIAPYVKQFLNREPVSETAGSCC